MTSISRRTALQAVAGAGALGLAVQRVPAAPAVPHGVDFADPLTALRMHVKMVGSLGNEVVCSFMRLNIYADLGEGDLVAFFTMNNILVDWWQAKEDNPHEMRKYEVGYYTRFDSHEPLERFDNPVTGKSVRIHHFRLGPVPRVCTPDGVIVMGFKPRCCRSR